MSKWLKFRFYCFVAFWYVVIFASIFICGWFNGKLIEATALLASYLILRYAYPKTYHCKQYWQCIFFSITTFCVVIPLTLPLSVSIFSSIFFGGLIGLGLCQLQTYEDKMHEEMRKPSIFDLDRNELARLLNTANITEEEKKSVGLRLLEHYKGQQWYRAMGYCKRNCQYLYKSGVEKLNKQLSLHQSCTKVD